MRNKKIYFAKYTSLIGDFREGYCLDTIKNEIVYYNGNYGEKIPEQLRPVQLSLCSRDIKDGDKFFFTENNPIYCSPKEQTYRRLEEKMVEENPLLPNFMYKIIAEISKAALPYVSAGDEFDEEQVSIRRLVDAAWNNGIFNEFLIREWDKMLDSNYPDWELQKDHGDYAFIKGPCSHFH